MAVSYEARFQLLVDRDADLFLNAMWYWSRFTSYGLRVRFYKPDFELHVAVQFQVDVGHLVCGYLVQFSLYSLTYVLYFRFGCMSRVCFRGFWAVCYYGR